MRFVFGLLLAFLLYACQNDRPQILDPWATTTVDSTEFQSSHHYWKNYVFLAKDSLKLSAFAPGEYGYIASESSAYIDSGDAIVVLNIVRAPTQNGGEFWVMIAKDDTTVGWLSETDLLHSAIPDNYITRFIHAFSTHRFWLLFVCFILGACLYAVQRYRHKGFPMVHFNDVKSSYPTLLCMVVSGSAVLYGAFQQFAPEMWEQFYYHPSLNVFSPAPLVLRLFLVSVWLIFIVAVAVVEDLRKQHQFLDAVAYLASLAPTCMVLYLFFSNSIHWYIGYPMLFIYWFFALRQHFQRNTARYRCGNCGNALWEKGVCPSCGAINE